MIKLCPETACMLYVGGLLFLLLGTWIRHSQRAKRREVVKLTKVHVSCEFCSHSYLAETFTPYHRCPKCHCMNSHTVEEK